MTAVMDVLKAARAEVAKGWCKNTLEDKDGNVCAIGAVSRAATGDAHSGVADNAAALGAWSVLREHVPAEYVCVLHAYNNAESTTQQDVLDLFDKTLADLGGLA